MRRKSVLLFLSLRGWSWKIENDNIQENTPIWGKLRLLLDSATQSYSEKTTVIKIAR